MKGLRIEVFDDQGVKITEIDCASFPFSIGRNEDCHLSFKHIGFSRVHATIEKRGQTFVLVDRESRNGTYDEGGRKISEIFIQDTLKFRIGPLLFQLTLKSGHAAPAVASLPASVKVREKVQHKVKMASPGLAEEGVGDRFDSIISVISTKLTALSALGLQCIIFVLLTFDLTVLTNGFSSLILAGVSATLTYLFARLFKHETGFKGLYWAYLFYFGVVSTLNALENGAILVSPQGGVAIPVLKILTSFIILLFFSFNLRWIFAANRRVIGLCTGAIACLIAIFLPTSGLRPRWETVLRKAEMSLVPLPMTESHYVSAGQLLFDISKSIERLDSAAKLDLKKSAKSLAEKPDH